MTPKISRSIANGLSKKSREFLILHVAGPVHIVINNLPAEDRTSTTRRSLLCKGLISTKKNGNARPIQTEITELGRWVASAVLADIADLLASTIEFIPQSPSVRPETPAGDALLRALIENHRRETIS